MRLAMTFSCGALLVIGACGGASETTDQTTSSSAPTSSTNPPMTLTTAIETTSTTLPSGILPVPPDHSLPAVASLVDVQVTLTPLLDIPHLLGMAWSEIEQYFYLITQDGEVFRAPPDLSSSEVVLDLKEEVSPFIYGSERGMLGVAVNPVDGRLFLNFTDQQNDSHIISYALEEGLPDVPSRREVIFIEQPGLSHKAGMLVFDDE